MVAFGFSGGRRSLALPASSNDGGPYHSRLPAKHNALFPLPNRDCSGCGNCQTWRKHRFPDGLHHADKPHFRSPLLGFHSSRQPKRRVEFLAFILADNPKGVSPAHRPPVVSPNPPSHLPHSLTFPHLDSRLAILSLAGLFVARNCSHDADSRAC